MVSPTRRCDSPTVHLSATSRRRHTPCITNPSFWPFENGSVLMACACLTIRPRACDALILPTAVADSTGCANCSVSAGHKHIGLAFGATFAGPFTDLTPHAPVFPFASEDPNIFRASIDF